MPRHCISLSRLRHVGAAALIALGSIQVLVMAGSAQTNQRRLLFENLVYRGAFRLPASQSNNDHFSYGGQAIAFNPGTPSLFVSSLAGRVAEVTIPIPAVDSDSKALPVATYVQGFADPTEGRLQEIASGGVFITSLLVQNARLYGTASIYYDAANVQSVSHFSRSLRLSERSFQGWSQVWEPHRAGFVAASLAAVPVDWQQRLGGAMASGQCCVPIISRTSFGPAAFAFNPTQIGQPVVPATPLLYYPMAHPTLGQWLVESSKPNPAFNQATEMGGMVLVAGTRTALYFGRTGVGAPCYGIGIADKLRHGTKDTDGVTFCYDPTNAAKGSHAYPYQYQIWAYDLNDFAAVKAGTKKPWEVLPYGVWPLEFPTPEPRTIMGGISYDPDRQTIYVVQRYADRDQYDVRPVIHTFQVR